MNARLLAVCGICLVVSCASSSRDAQQAPRQPGPEPVVDWVKEWSFHYANAHLAFEADDLAAAERELKQAEAITPRLADTDPRVAETFDEEGLLYFLLKDYATCERKQGIAAALALLNGGVEDHVFGVYRERLGRAYTALDSPKAEQVDASPFALLGLGYVEATPPNIRKAKALLERRAGANDAEGQRLLERFIQSGGA
jgi:hypothetical protein